MQLTDHRDIEARPEDVWAAILDADVLKACIPGCEDLTGTAEDGFQAVVVQKVGPVKAKFKGEVTISDMVAPVSCVLAGAGKGGPAGFAKGGATITLEPVTLENGAGGTRLNYDVEAKVGGKLAQLGSRVIDGFTKKLADQFFERFQTALEGPAEDAGDPVEAKKSWLKKLVG